jgi:hypothetical protein
MGCEICNRNSCTRSFHSLDEQREFDSYADSIKDRLKTIITRQVDRLSTEEIDGVLYVRILDVFDVIDSAG